MYIINIALSVFYFLSLFLSRSLFEFTHAYMLIRTNDWNILTFRNCDAMEKFWNANSTENYRFNHNLHTFKPMSVVRSCSNEIWNKISNKIRNCIEFLLSEKKSQVHLSGEKSRRQREKQKKTNWELLRVMMCLRVFMCLFVYEMNRCVSVKSERKRKRTKNRNEEHGERRFMLAHKHHPTGSHL